MGRCRVLTTPWRCDRDAHVAVLKTEAILTYVAVTLGEQRVREPHMALGLCCGPQVDLIPEEERQGRLRQLEEDIAGQLTGTK